MKRFKFRLARVQQYRHAVTNEHKRELLARNQELRESERHLEELEFKARANELMSGGDSMTGTQVHLNGFFGQRLVREIEAQRERIIECERAVEVAKEAYIAARREEQALERLRDKKKAQYQAYCDQIESNLLDEFSTQRSGALRSRLLREGPTLDQEP